jgi:phosphotransferase system enzyme I (PtsI)
MGIGDALSAIYSGDTIILDALEGTIIIEPDKKTLGSYTAKVQGYKKQQAKHAAFLDKKAVTTDGVDIEIHLNIGSPECTELESASFVDGVGLFRSEFLFMNSPNLPTEDEQFAAYCKVLIQFGEKPVILRTFDIGGDKHLESFPLPVEQNPFLGNRALRFCFSRQDIFHTQLRAALRASAAGNLQIMFPMVGNMEDIHKAKKALESAKEELRREKIPFQENIKIGIMIEIPAIALIADMAAKEVDFASIGTNDLCQYALAVDRLNPAVAPWYQSCHPAMFRLIRTVVQEFSKQGKPVSVCGEMASDPFCAVALVGIGIRKLSMNAGALGEVKKTISRMCSTEMAEIAERICEIECAQEIEAYLKEKICINHDLL